MNLLNKFKCFVFQKSKKKKREKQVHCFQTEREIGDVGATRATWIMSFDEFNSFISSSIKSSLHLDLNQWQILIKEQEKYDL